MNTDPARDKSISVKTQSEASVFTIISLVESKCARMRAVVNLSLSSLKDFWHSSVHLNRTSFLTKAMSGATTLENPCTKRQ